MFSGKTTWLTLQLTKYADLGYPVVKIVYDDKREITTHNSSCQQPSQKIHVLHAKNLCDVNVCEYEIIGIDEAQFFGDLYDFVYDLVEKHGKFVNVVGLDGDSNKDVFGQVLKLCPISDSFKKMKACCKMCDDEQKSTTSNYTNRVYTEAPFTKCMVSKDSQVLIGASNEYVPVCRKHHM